METILVWLTLSRLLTGVIILTSIWLLKVIIQKEKYNFIRGMLFFLFLLLAFLYVNESQRGQITVYSVYDQIFPQKPLNLKYRTEVVGSPPNEVTTYTFQRPRPPIRISLDKTGEYSHLKNPRPLNRILSELGLPEVTSGAPELASITGSHLDRSQYRWPHYPLGVLLVEKTRCQNRDSVQFYDCVIKIYISRGL